MEEGREAGARAYRGELVAGVADEHAGLAHRAVAHRHALDELGHAHLSLPLPTLLPPPSSSSRTGRGGGWLLAAATTSRK